MFSTSPSCEGSWKNGIIGGVDAALGMIGLSGLLPKNKDAQEKLERAQENMANARDKWEEAILNLKFQITQDQFQYLQSTINYSNAFQQITNQKLFEVAGF